MNTIHYGNTTKQVDIAKYIKELENTRQNQELEVIKEPEKSIEPKSIDAYDEVKTALRSAKMPVTEENIKTAGLMIKSGIEVKKENMDAAVNIKKQVEYVVNHISVESVSSITSNGMSLDKITMDILEDVIADVDSEGAGTIKEISAEEIEKAKDGYLSKNALENTLSSSQMHVLTLSIESLMRQGLPITTKNVQSIVATVDMAYDIGAANENIAISLIRKNQPATLENSYVAKYSSNKYSDKTANHISDEDFKELLPQIEKLIEAEGLQDKRGSMGAAKLLVDNGLPVTGENIAKIMSMSNIQIEGIDIEKVVCEAVKNIKTDKEVAGIELYKITGKVGENYYDIEKINIERNEQKYKNTINNIPKYDDETIKQAIENSETVTLKELQIAYETMKQQVLQKDETAYSTKNTEVKLEHVQQFQIDIEKELKTVTAKRQLAEIRLRLTTESMTTLIKKGIEIDTMPLKEVIDKLKAVEAELYKSSLNRAGVEKSAENIAEMEDLYTKLENIKKLTPSTYSQVIQVKIPFTINALSESEEINLKQLPLQQATSSYERAQTQTNTRYGDVFSKITDQIAPLVLELGVEATEENIRAAEILVKNNMEVTNENIQAIKLIDIKVDKITTQLHPTIAAHMIKDGFNIVQTNIDEVINYMDSFKTLLGEDLTDKIANYIYDMDKAGEVTETERETMIGIYRMLYTVEKTEGRATGFLLKNGMDLTLGNLMEAANYYDRTSAKHSDIDVKIDDNFGALEDIIINDRSIKAQLNASQLENQTSQESSIKQQPHLNTSEYDQNIIAKFIEKAQPDILSKVINQYKNIESMTVENILKAIETVEDTESLQAPESNLSNKTQEFINKLNKLSTIEPTTMLWMKNNTIPLTVSNIETMDNFMKDAFWFGDQIKDFSEQVKEKLGIEEVLKNVIPKTSLSGLKGGESATDILEAIQEEISKAKKQAINLPEEQRQSIWKQADNLEKVIQLQKQVQQDETFYQIPIQLSGGLTNMNLYVMNDKEGNGKLSETNMKIFVAMETETLGTVQIYMKLTEKNVSFQINTDHPEATKFLQAQQSSLQRNIEELGYRVSKMRYGQEEKKSPLQTQIQPQVKGSRKNISSDGFEVII